MHNVNQMPMMNQPAARQPFPAEIANFALLPSRNRSSDRSPAFFGSFKIDGVWYSVSTWENFNRTTGEKFYSNSVRPCTPEEAYKNEQRDQAYNARRQQAPMQQQMQYQQQPAPQYNRPTNNDTGGRNGYGAEMQPNLQQQQHWGTPGQAPVPTHMPQQQHFQQQHVQHTQIRDEVSGVAYDHPVDDQPPF